MASLNAPSLYYSMDSAGNLTHLCSRRFTFKPPLLETLAREAGIEPGVLDLLKKIGLTNEAELRSRLGLTDGADTGNEISSHATITLELAQENAQDSIASEDARSSYIAVKTDKEEPDPDGLDHAAGIALESRQSI
jgi:hypothetical protein